MADREMTLVELLEEAHGALVDYLLEHPNGAEKVEDAMVLVYDALALVDPHTADDRAETRRVGS